MAGWHVRWHDNAKDTTHTRTHTRWVRTVRGGVTHKPEHTGSDFRLCLLLLICTCTVSGVPFRCHYTNKCWIHERRNGIKVCRLCKQHRGQSLVDTHSRCLSVLVEAAVALMWRHRRRPDSFIMKAGNIIRNWQPRKSAKMYHGMNGHTLVIWLTKTRFPSRTMNVSFIRFIMSSSASCYQLYATRPAFMVLQQPSEEVAGSPHQGCNLSAWS